MKLAFIINLLALLLTINCKFTFFLDVLRPTSYFKCIRPSTDGQIILPLAYDDEDVDDDNIANIQNALAANMTVELIIAPYRCRTVEEEIKFVSSQIDIKVLKRFWVVLDNDPGDPCSWIKYSAEDNCQYLQDLIEKWKALNVQIQVVSFKGCWASIFKSDNACPEPSKTSLLWWLDQYQSQPTGGWKTPYMTYLTSATLCGDDILVNRININKNLNVEMI